MKLVKTNENVNRTFVDGKPKDEVTGINYSITEGDKMLGYVSVTPYNYNININGDGGSIEANEKAVKALLGIE